MIETVIFDMDGVLIDSEPLWKKAEKTIFNSLGVTISDEQARVTATMTTSEVTQFWFKQQPWNTKSLHEAENEVINLVDQLIISEGSPKAGVKDLLAFFKEKGFRIGLATNSPFQLIPRILDKIRISNYFDVISSAEHEEKGKPNPAVYLSTAKKLNVAPKNCLVFEDSVSGLKAAKSAKMTTVAIVQQNEMNNQNLNISDLIINELTEFTNEHLIELNRKASI